MKKILTGIAIAMVAGLANAASVMWQSGIMQGAASEDGEWDTESKVNNRFANDTQLGVKVYVVDENTYNTASQLSQKDLYGQYFKTPADAESSINNFRISVSTGATINEDIYVVVIYTYTDKDYGAMYMATAAMVDGDDIATDNTVNKYNIGKSNGEAKGWKSADMRSDWLPNLKYDTVPGEDGYPLLALQNDPKMLELLELEAEDLKDWTITGLPTGITFNSSTGTFSGMPIEGGQLCRVVFTKDNEKASIRLKTAPAPELTLVTKAYGDESAGGTATKGGNYTITGATALLTAKANTGSVFAGWYLGEDPLEGTMDYRTADKYQWTVATNDTTITAMFATKDEDKERLKLKDSVETSHTVTGPWELDLSDALDSLSQPTLDTVTIAPANKGLTYDKNTKKVSGTPQQTGTYTLTVKAKNVSTSKSIPITVNVPKIVDEELFADLNADGYTLDAGVIPAELTAFANTVTSLTAAGWKVERTGTLPAGVKYDAKTGLFSGTGTKDGETQTIYFKATKTGETARWASTTLTTALKTLTLTTAPYGESTATGTATVNNKTSLKVYNGQVLTLTAKPTSGTKFVFAGWYDGENKLPGENRAESYSWTAGMSNVEITAKFATDEQDAEIQINTSDDATDADGIYELDLIDKVVSISLPKITVSGLPNGLKFDSKTNKISGKATAPGKYKVTVSATNATVKKAETKTFELTVPNWRPDLFDYEWLKDNYRAVAGVLEDSTALLGGLGDLINEGWSIKVSGLPTGMSYKAATKTQPMAITGTATKEGYYTMYIEASKKGEKTQKATTTINVTFPELKVAAGNVMNMEETATMGTVTGGGNYYAGKKVTLKATAAKDYAFAGWYKYNAGTEIWVPLGEGEPNAEDFRKTSYSYVTADEDETIMGAFVDKTTDAGTIDMELYGDEEIYQVGTNYVIGVGVDSLSLPSISVSGLPTGMKFDAKTMTITGKPTKYGELKDAVFTLKNVSNTTGKKVTMRFRVADQRATGLDGLKYDTIPGETGGYDLIEVGTEVNADLLGVGPENLKNWTVSGLPAGVKFNKATGEFSGKATAVGVTYLVTLTQGQQKATVLLKTKGNPELKVEVRKIIRSDYDADLCGVDPDESLFIITGTGSYATGKKVTLNVSAMPKNWLFIGWAEYQTEDNETALVLVSPDAKYAFNMPDADANNEVKLVAVFTHVFGWDEEE